MCDSRGVDIVISLESARTAPYCAHGPTLLFERYVSSQSLPRRYYACSACRSRKECQFFQWADRRKSQKRSSVKRRKQEIMHHRLHKAHFSRLKKLLKVNCSERRYCKTCSSLLMPEDDGHNEHCVIMPVSDNQLRSPTQLLPLLSNNKTNAQYLFSKATTDFLVNLIIAQGKSRVLCIGAPRLFEALKLHNKSTADKACRVKCLLLDIDERLAQFIGPRQFCRYNMFNHYFFCGDDSRSDYLQFLKKCSDGDSADILVVVDPPFGGHVAVIAFTLQRIADDYKNMQKDSSMSMLPTLWFFPYFMEPRVTAALPSFTMLDYQVEYENHSSFSGASSSAGLKKESPVRIFTNLDPSTVVLPASEGYWFCDVCLRYCSQTNIHCSKCDRCTTKFGRQYVHCDKCQRCVKPTWSHCNDCNTCELIGHHSASVLSTGCHICGASDHKRQSCPKYGEREHSGKSQRPLKRKRRVKSERNVRSKP